MTERHAANYGNFFIIAVRFMIPTIFNKNIAIVAIFLLNRGRGDRNRTCDPLHPMQVLYQAELHPDMPDNITDKNKKHNLFL